MSAAPVISEQRLAAVGALLIALGPISMALYTPAMPQLVAVFGTEVAAVKLTLTAYFGGFALAQLVCGPISDAAGRRPVVLAFTSLYLAGSVVALLAPSIDWLIVARIVQGIGAAVGVAVSRAMVRDLYTGQKSVQIMNLIGLMLAVGPALSPTLGGITLELFGWHAIFLFMVLYGLAIIAVFLTVVPETLAKAHRRSLRPTSLIRSYRGLLADPRFLRPSIVLGCTNGALYALATMLPFVLIDETGLTPTQFGIGMLTQTGSFAVGSLIMRRLLSTIEAHRLVPIGLALIALGGALLATFLRLVDPSFLTVMGPVGLIAFGIAFTMPSLMTDSLGPFPHIAGAAAALTGFFQMGGGLLGSAIAAAMDDPVSALATVIPAMAAIAVIGHFALQPAVRRKERQVAAKLNEAARPDD
jgi:DHA1 family bicyclomycin/chloramphenicol resistance-like MFS transporter